MKKRFLITMLLMLAASLAASLAAGAQPCDGGDTACLEKQVNGHAVRQMRFWEQYFALPIEQRVNVAPKEVVEYINLDNRLQGYPEDTKLADVSGDFLGDVKNAVKGIPGGIANVMKGKLAGVFLVNDLGGTGYTEYISDEKGRRVAGFIVLDAGVLKGRKANEWATWKESTPFAGDKDHKIEVVIERGPDDNRQQAIQYILLHEIGHVISVNETIHPPWGVAPEELGNINEYRFFSESWLVDMKQGKYASRFDGKTFPRRKEVVYYQKPALAARQMAEVYGQLEKTNFVSLYAATHPADDWAESFVTYVHGVLLKKPFRVNITNKGKLVKSFELCWGTTRCASKEALMKKLLKGD